MKNEMAELVERMGYGDAEKYASALPSIEETDSIGAYQDVVLTTDQLTAGNVVPLNTSGYELHVLSLGGSGGGYRLRLGFDNANTQSMVLAAPGQSFYGFFKNAYLYAENAPSAGSVILRVVKKKDKTFKENGISPASGAQALGAAMSPSTASSTANTPSGATAGVSLNGVRSFRILVEVASGQTITSGSIRLWYYINGAWRPSDVVINITSPAAGAHRYFVSTEYEVVFGNDRVFASAETVVTSSGNPIVYIQTWSA